jgi:hypothetical protein
MVEDYLFLILISIAGGLSTYLLAKRIGNVKASALLSLIVALLVFEYFKYHEITWAMNYVPVIFFGASFVGMSAGKTIKSWAWICIASLIFVAIFLGFPELLKGFGGGLGTKAFISVVSTILLIKLFSKLKHDKRLV